LKSIWYLSGADNPYADCILIRVYDGLATLRARVAELTAAREATLAQLRRKGLMFEVLESARPVTVALGFRSPYGFAIAEAILEFDYYVRLVQTLVQKDRLSDVDGVTEIRSLSHSLFGLFYKATRWERLLLRGELQHLSRGDFKPDASAEAQQRVTAAAALFGKLPRNILLGSEQPRHSRRRVSVRATDQGAVPQPLPSTAVMISPDAAVDATVATDEPHSGTASTIFANVSRETPEATMPPASGAL
jgi:integrating conjugative element protein (TIGR03761 family)